MRAALVLGLVIVGAVAPVQAAAPDARTSFIKSCVTQMYYPQTVCACMADKAATSIGPQGMAYLSLQALDVAHSTAMSKAMSGSERNKIDAFMKTAPHQCEKAPQ